MRFSKCICCHKPFTDENVFTKLGWNEVEISGLCEKCFDEVTEDREEPDESEWDL